MAIASLGVELQALSQGDMYSWLAVIAAPFRAGDYSTRIGDVQIEEDALTPGECPIFAFVGDNTLPREDYNNAYEFTFNINVYHRTNKQIDCLLYTSPSPRD